MNKKIIQFIKRIMLFKELL